MNQDMEQAYRYHERLQTYWESLRGGKSYPSENDIDPDDIADIWDSCFLISIDDVTRRSGYRYSYLGKDLIEAYGNDVQSPDIVSHLVATSGVPVIEKLDAVIRDCKPVIDESEFVNRNQLKIKYRSCLLPLGYAEGEVSHILGCMRWRAY